MHSQRENMQPISRKEARQRGLSTYYTGKPCPAGHVSERITSNCGCAECGRQRARERMRGKSGKESSRRAKASPEYKKAQAEYSRRPDVKERRRRIYAEKDKGQITAYREKNKDRAAQYAKQYYAENRDNILASAKRRASDPEFSASRKIYIRGWAAEFRKSEAGKLVCAMRKMVSRCLKNKRDRTSTILGYTADQLKSRIESGFLPGMSWENHGEWHIDHIKPIAVFHREGVTCPAIINALTNLQPLWAKDNLSKGDKY